MLRWDGYLRSALSLGRPVLSEHTDAAKLFSIGEKLSFFKADFLLSFILVPAMAFVFYHLFGKRLVLWTLALVSIIWIVVINIQLEAYRLIGNYQPVELLRDGLQWGLSDAAQAKSYILSMAVVRTGALVTAVLIIAALVPYLNALPGVWMRWVRIGAAASYLFGCTGSDRTRLAAVDACDCISPRCSFVHGRSSGRLENSSQSASSGAALFASPTEAALSPNFRRARN